MFIVFAKGEIIMNNIYKVIWSKAKNCYVVASEIAKSHTKSASGQSVRRSALASLLALSLLCGGLGAVSAADVVHVNESAPGTAEVYTKTGVDNLLKEYGKKENVETNKNDIITLRTTTTDQEQKITANTTDIANIKTAIDKKIDTVTADARYATRTEVDAKADKTALDTKADKDTVTALDGRVGVVEGKVTTLEGKVGDASSGLVKDVADLKNQGNDLNNALGNKADQSALDAAKAKITTNETNINALQTKTAKLSPDGTKLTGMNSVETGALTVKGEISNGAGVTTTLADIKDSMKQTDTNKTWIRRLKDKTTEISYADGEGTKISGVTIKNGNIVGDGNSAITQLANVETDKIETDSINGKSLTGTTVATEKEVKDVADAVKTETDERKAADTALEEKITKNTQDIATLDESGVKYDNAAVKDTITLKGPDSTKITNLKDADLSDSSTDAVTGKQLNKTNEDLKTEAQTRKDMDTLLSNRADALEKNTGGITRNDAKDETYIERNVTVDNQGNITAKGKVTANGGVDAGAVNAGSLNVTDASHLKGDVTMDKKLSVTGDTSLNKTDVDGALTVTGASNLKGDVTLGTPNGTNTVTVNGTANFYAAAKMNNDLTVTGDTNLGNTTVDGNLKVTGTITTDKMVFGDPATNNYTEIDHGKVTSKNSYVNGEGQLITSSSTFNAEENEVGFTNTATGDHSSHKQTAKGINGYVTDKDGNKTYTKVTATENSFQVQDKDGKNKNHQVNTKDSSVTEITNGDGKTTKTEQTATDITNTAKDGTITNDANHIVNKANTMDTNVTGKATESYGSLDTTVNGNETHIVTGTKTETVDGMVTENYKAGQATNVTGNQDIHVTGKQTNTVEGGQENIISGGQTNTITGGQINNITGDQTTTITGNKTETVTENVTEDYKKDLTTTVGGNETHEVKGTKTETVEGKVTENYNGGQETNVTGDQVIKVSGTQTTTATDINRNASSGMIDTIDNDYGTNTETKVAGKTTTDVSIKGTGEEGKYIRGANESRDYLIKGTLKNSETKTVDATSTEITDGKGKTSATIQDVNNLAGSVTNSTETGVSGIHANDNSVSIDSIVTDGNKYSVINQKKGSIQSTVVDGTNSTVILQDKDNVTIASSKGMVAIGGKDIVNNAQDTITNTAGTSITNQVKDSKVTTDANGTTFENNTPAVSDGGATTTKINGNQITTGRVNANELAVSDKDGDNTADFSVKAGEGVKASAGNGTTTGSLDVKADGIYGYAADKDGNKTYTKVTATENNFQIQDKDGKIKNHQVNTKDKSENTITNGDKTNTVTSTADGTTFNNSKANTAFEGGKYTDTTIKGNTITTGKVTMDYADVMKDLGVYGNTTLGEAGKDTTLTVNSKATFNEIATFENGAEVKNGLTVSSGGLNVTGESTFNDKVTMKNGLDVTGGVASDSFTVKGTDIKIDSSGINAGGTVISNVADGSISEGSKDAVNGGQLYQVKNDLEGKVNKVGANAAAMANLHPMEFDPDSKWNIAAAIGNYGSETAAALGAFYRPNDDVMVNLSTAFGTGENMVGGGVSVRLGKSGNKLSREESNALKDQVNDLTARMDALLSVLNPNMSKDFPDVPENHWAYEAVSRLAGNDIVQGYPDGEFHGERTMTRYEMAEIIYNALSRGAEAEKELVEEFKPELQAMAASEKATAERAEG